MLTHRSSNVGRVLLQVGAQDIVPQLEVQQEALAEVELEGLCTHTTLSVRRRRRLMYMESQHDLSHQQYAMGHNTQQ